MTETEKKNLAAARANLIKGNSQEALEYYLEVNKENEDNPEAKYIVFNTLFTNEVNDGKTNEALRTSFLATSKTLEGAIKYVAESDASVDEKLAATKVFIDYYVPVAEYALPRPITSADVRIQLAAITLYTAGNAIESAYKSNKEAMKLAAYAWKEGVKIQQKFYAYKYEGNKAEDYAAKIQKVDPSYTMPQKAGCISKG